MQEPAEMGVEALGPEAVTLRPIRLVRGGRARSGSRRRRQTLGLVGIDLASVCLSVALGSLIVSGTVGISGRSWALLWFAVPVALVSFRLHGVYRRSHLRLVPGGMPIVTGVARSLPLAALALVALFVAAGPWNGAAAFGVVVAVLLPVLVLVPLFRSVVATFGTAQLLGKRQRVLIVGSGEAADSVAGRLRRFGGLEVIGMVDDDPLPGFETIGGVTDIVDLCAQRHVDQIVVALPRAAWLDVSEVLQSIIGTVEISVVPSLHQLMTWRSGTRDLAGIPLIPLMPAQRGTAARLAKRAVDLVVGSAALVVLSPVLLAAIIAIRLDSKGPALFRQLRSGQDNRPFKILKLRTMYEGAEARREELFDLRDADGPRFKMSSDPRVTRVGAVLRRYSIDELPQLFNVLSGKMSLVGPRPYPLVESEAFQVGSATSRFDMPPGMTGLWQVSGRSDLTWDDLCRLDAIYVKSWSLLWDLRILLQTPAVTLRSQGAY